LELGFARCALRRGHLLLDGAASQVLQVELP
jgi:hypothetical protein